MKKYKVTWDETIRHEATVEADNSQAAEDIVCSGVGDVEDHETDSEFNGVTKVVEVTEIPTISTKKRFCVPVTYTITGWVIVHAVDKKAAAKEVERLNDEGVAMEDIEDPDSHSECHLDELSEVE